MVDALKTRADWAASIVAPPPPKWGKPGRPAKADAPAPAAKLPRPAYRKRGKT